MKDARLLNHKENTNLLDIGESQCEDGVII